MSQLPPSSRMSSLLELEYPQSVGVYETYAEAQKVVDFLADSRFPVQNLAIVGTELRSVERVTGRRTWGTVLGVGLQNGVTTGLIVALLMWFVQPQTQSGDTIFTLFAYALAMGLVIGVVISVVAHLMSRGRRDFTSVSQTVATKYEVLAEHKVAAQARELVNTMPGARAAMFNPPPRPPYAGYGSGPVQGYGSEYPPPYPPAGYPGGAYPAPAPNQPVPPPPTDDSPKDTDGENGTPNSTE